MLLACSDSRKTARHWYQLAFRTDRWVNNDNYRSLVWFDFQADYLFAGCSTCCGSSGCLAPTASNDHYRYIPTLCTDVGLIQNVLFPWNDISIHPFYYELYTHYSGAREIILVNTKEISLLPETRPSDFKEKLVTCQTQRARQFLIDVYLDKAEKYAAKGWFPDHHPEKGGPDVNLKNIAAVELAVTSDTS